MPHARWILFPLLLALVAGFAPAQSSQSGALIGAVTASDGTTIPGVTVTAASPVLVLGKATAVTNENGVFRFANLAPGSYEVTFELDGFRTVIRKDVRVSAMQTYSLNVKLTQEAIKEAIVVTGKGPTVDTQRQTRAANLDLEFLKSIPAQRNLAAFINMTPGLIGTGGQQTSAHGSSTMDNSYNLDGVNLGDPTTGVQYVGFGMDIMDEISVQTGGLSAEYGSVRGAMVNVVTKSGGNRLSGGASFFFNHESLKGDNTQNTPLAGQRSGNKYEIEPSFSLGGPIVKDRLWFFASGTYNKRAQYFSGFPYDQESEVPNVSKRPYPYFKLTFQPNQQNKFVVSYNGSNNINNNRIDGPYPQWFKEDGVVTQKSPTHVFNAQWTHYFGSNIYANFKVGGVKYKMLLDAKLDEPQYQDYYTHLYTGGYWRNQDHNYRDRYNVNVDATTFIDNFLGTHELKIGGEAQLARTKWKIYGVPDPITHAAFNAMIGNDYYYGLILLGNGFDRKENIDDYFGFVQDTWRVNRHLTLNLGLRLEYNSITWPQQGDPNEGELSMFGFTFNRYIAEPIKAMEWTTLAPRVGLIYDIFGDSKTLFKASWARYTMPNSVQIVNVAHKNGWAGYLQWFNPDGSNYPFQAYWASPGATHVGYKDYGLKAPYTDELSIGMEREMFNDWSLGVRYLRKWDRRLVHVIDAADLDADKLMATGEIVWNPLNWAPVTGVDPYTGQSVTFYNQLRTRTDQYITNPPGATRDYQGLEVTLNKRFNQGWALNASYVYGKSTGLINTSRGGQALGTSTLFANPNAHINSLGNLDLECRHQFKLQAMVKGPLGVNLSGYFRYLSGLPWTRLISSRRLGISLRQGSTQIYAEARGQHNLSATKQLDLRLEKVFKVGNWNLSAFADCFNAFNQGIATSVWQDSSDTSYPFERMMSISAPRVFQLGVRFEFN